MNIHSQQLLLGIEFTYSLVPSLFPHAEKKEETFTFLLFFVFHVGGEPGSEASLLALEDISDHLM